MDTEENRVAGNLSYMYWSFLANKSHGGQTWRNTGYFFPRRLKLDKAIAVDPARPPIAVSPSGRWLTTDFFRRGAPFPHARFHGKGLNVGFLDGHVDLVVGKPKLNYK